MLAGDKELEMALVRLKAKCPEECGLVLERLETDARRFAAAAATMATDPTPGAWEAARGLMAAYGRVHATAAALREADGLEPEEGEKPKYDRSIDQ